MSFMFGGDVTDAGFEVAPSTDDGLKPFRTSKANAGLGAAALGEIAAGLAGLGLTGETPMPGAVGDAVSGVGAPTG